MNYASTTSSGLTPTSKAPEPKAVISGNGWDFSAELDKNKDLIIEVSPCEEHSEMMGIKLRLNKPSKKQLESLGTLFNSLAIQKK